MKPTVGAIVVVGALLTFGILGALLVGSCAREETKMEGKSRDEVVAKAREVLRSKLNDLQSQVDRTECACVIAIMADEQGEVSGSVVMGGVVKDPVRFGVSLAASIEEVKKGLRAIGPCDCPDCRAARAHAQINTIMRGAAQASGSHPGFATGSPHGPKDN
ncbi:hypothetical protein FVW20_00605 [Desulfovibrio oxamicus]|uniref:Uncharacterized protein n=1 Tax=Nitratidesulfovibrio oxamicus TaxID=32016 RepID=A0ABS0J1C3_9BACT|nr:hypothetical protein [Nitratidesulfovibrio oxamicus]MBG3875563.1 hypothetical protein [Nitratidesulfovibrio oxamicus]